LVKRRVSLTISQEVLAAASEEAKKLGISTSTLVQLVLDGWLKRGRPSISVDVS